MALAALSPLLLFCALRIKLGSPGPVSFKQLNVIRGEMSLVGPRPLTPEEAHLIDGRYSARFKVTPGVTGAWQAHGRSDIGFEDMLKFDYTYVMSWTFKEDLKLILRTVEVIARRGVPPEDRSVIFGPVGRAGARHPDGGDHSVARRH